jgi:hypothetical protein
MKLSDE